MSGRLFRRIPSERNGIRRLRLPGDEARQKEEKEMIDNYRYYLHRKYGFHKSTRFAIGLAIWVIGGILGFIYEVLFYWFNSGQNTWFWRGGTFGPWIEMYCIAAVCIYLIMYPLRRKPWLVIPLSGLGCAAVQLLAGLCLYYFCGGTRAWNYNLEILNFGNFGGFVCVRTVVEYAVLGFLVIYVIAPLICTMATALTRKTFVTFWMVIGLVCLADIVYNDVACMVLAFLPSASDIYQGLGFHYLNF